MSDSILHTGFNNHTEVSTAKVSVAILTATINVVSGTFASILNALLLHNLIHHHKSASRILICNLAATDLLTGLIVQPSYVVYILTDLTGTRSNIALFVFNFTAYLLCGISLATAGFMSIDRLLATLMPFRYKIYSKPRLYTGIVVSIWLQGISFVALYVIRIITNTLAQLAFSLTVCFAVLSLVISYAIILKKFRAITHQITHDASLQSTNQRQQKQKRMTKTVALMVVTLCLMYLPMFVVKTLLWKSDSSDLHVLNTVNRITNTVTFLNSSLNPVLYCYGNKAMRVLIKDNFSAFSTFIDCRRLSGPSESDNINQPHIGSSFA